MATYTVAYHDSVSFSLTLKERFLTPLEAHCRGLELDKEGLYPKSWSVVAFDDGTTESRILEIRERVSINEGLKYATGKERVQ